MRAICSNLWNVLLEGHLKGGGVSVLIKFKVNFTECVDLWARVNVLEWHMNKKAVKSK